MTENEESNLAFREWTLPVGASQRLSVEQSVDRDLTHLCGPAVPLDEEAPATACRSPDSCL